ncbi:hypothetical protein [Synechococcus sp. SYN20]|uniref:hypothetical protein n=1 Tax=Synechococcus sp. SYN20 TaxID=1050714 RepID=UPI001645EEFD|nr:hypothetical protein [Synechococcus sp. SYN20]
MIDGSVACIQHPGITVTFTDGTTLYKVQIDKFTAEPRQFVEAGQLTFSTSGTATQSGSSRANRMTWAISAFASVETCFSLDELYRAWDAARASGLTAVVAITDQTRVRDPINSPITASAVFTAPPVFERRSGVTDLLSFGLTEI